jgi:hypothetical protein
MNRDSALPLRTSGNKNDLPSKIWNVLVRIEIYTGHGMLHTVIDVLRKQVGGAISTSGKGKTEVFFDRATSSSEIQQQTLNATNIPPVARTVSNPAVIVFILHVL